MASAVQRLAGDGDNERQNVDYRLEHFVLDPADSEVRFRKLDPKDHAKYRAGTLDIAGGVTDSRLELTVEGASTLELTLLDVGLKLLRGDLLTQWAWGRNADDRDEDHWMVDGRVIDAKLDDLWFRLVRVPKTAIDTLGLTFEDRTVGQLREHRGPEKMYRTPDTTRALFVQRLCKKAGVESFIPELHEKQPIASSDQKVTAKERRTEGKKGLHPQTAGITVKGVKANPSQLRILQRALDVADSLNAPERAVLALICAAIAESTVSTVTNSSGHGGPWQSNIIPATDVEQQAHYFLVGGRSFQAGGAIHLARTTGLSPGGIANLVEAGGAGAGFYDAYRREADKIYAGFHGRSAGSVDTSLSVEVEKPFAWSVGAKTNYWDAIQKLAEDVQWRAFVRKGVLWYVSEDYLFNQQPQLLMREGHGPVDEITFEIDLGSRDLVNELTVTAHAKTWTVLPGMVAQVAKGDQGPADGRWIVHSCERALHDDLVTVTLNKKLPAKPEPAPETETLSVDVPGVGGLSALSSKASPVAKLLAKAVEISKRNLPYTWGGGHVPSFQPSGSPPGYDCSGYVSACLHAGGLLGSPLDSTGLMSWGQPGKGKYFTVYANGEHTFIVFHGLGKYKRADTSPQVPGERHGPHVRAHDRSVAGFVARHAKGL
jgi:hypothetical protein